MKLKPNKEEAYKNYKKVNESDAYSNRVVTYGEDWANLTEARINAGEQLIDVIEETSRQADTDGITGFMYNCAVQALCEFWAYGEDLRVWHNLKVQLRNEGEAANKKGTVLNSAVINIETDRERKERAEIHDQITRGDFDYV